MGTIAIAVLKDIRADQPEEAQSRINQILAALEKTKAK
jgi:hypothetical protein